MDCVKHKKYRGYNKPKHSCIFCWVLYLQTVHKTEAEILTEFKDSILKELT